MSRASFLKDVFLCSLGAYGGPEAHMGVFLDQMVVKRRYLDEEELIELIALCSLLPGPTSTQTIVAIGHKTGGPLLGLLTMIVWACPVLLVMTALSFLYQFLDMLDISRSVLRYVGPMAAGFIAVAAFRIGRKVVTDRVTAFLLLFGAGVTFFYRNPWVFPAVLLSGGAVMLLLRGEQGMWRRAEASPPWRYLVLFLLFAAGGAVMREGGFLPAELFERFYRYGYLVFGGGQVVVPLMFSELVEARSFLTGQEFLTGYGLVQGLPGPMFSFAAYAAGMAAREGSIPFQALTAIAGGVGIFLPGLLLIYFVYPVWNSVREIRAIRISLRGINAAAGGMIAASAALMMGAAGFSGENLAVFGATAALLVSGKIPAPLIVAASLAAGALI